MLCLSLLLCAAKAQEAWEVPKWVDTTFSCVGGKPLQHPNVLMQCPTICVVNATTDCPPEFQCASGTTLCPDGACYDDAIWATNCTTAAEDDVCAARCQQTCGPYTAMLDVCLTNFSSYYNQSTAYAEENCSDADIPYVSYDLPGFLFFFIWISVVGGVSLLFCLFNHRICLRESDYPRALVDKTRRVATATSASPAQAATGDFLPPGWEYGKMVKDGRNVNFYFNRSTNVSQWTHPGEIELTTMEEEKKESAETPKEKDMIEQHYGLATSYLGVVLYALVVATAVGFQILFIILCIMYYVASAAADGDPQLAVSEELNKNPIPSPEQALYVFQVAWYMSIIWVLFMKWPTSLISMFRTRCALEEADYVVVTHYSVESVVNTSRSLNCMRKGVQYFSIGVNFFFGNILSAVPYLQAFSFKTGVFTMETVCKVKNYNGKRSIVFKLRHYDYNPELKAYQLSILNVGETLKDLKHCETGLASMEAAERLEKMGENKVDIPEPSILGELYREFDKLFYVYQNHMSWSWFNFSYWHMGIVNTIVYVFGGLSIVWVNYQNAKSLYNLAKIPDRKVDVLREGKWEQIAQSSLVPGDIVQVKTQIKKSAQEKDEDLSCDMVLLTGSCLMDESSLTGESMPVAKVHCEAHDDAYDPALHKKFTLFAGTLITEADANVPPTAVITNTGAWTSKGEQLRDILYTKTPLFKFDIQVQLVVGILCLYAIFGFLITISFLGEDPVSAWFYALYVVSSALPPLLPTVFVVSVGISSKRLATRDVVCSDPNRILMAGKVRIGCFDKTGTLTVPGLLFEGVVPVTTVEDSKVAFGERVKKAGLAENASVLLKGMSVCHGLAETSKGVKLGNAVDIDMFNATGFKLNMQTNTAPQTSDATALEMSGSREIFDYDTVVSPSKDVNLSVVLRFDFDQHLQTMCSVVRCNITNTYFLYIKGSAERIRDRCVGAVPADYDSISDGLSRQGYYVIAMASRQLTEAEVAAVKSKQRLVRKDLEQGATFQGFVLFINPPKGDTKEALQLLRAGSVRNVMISGDHILTAIYMAKTVELLPAVDEQGNVRTFYWAKKVVQGKISWLDINDNPMSLPDDLTHVELAVSGEVYNFIEKDNELKKLLFEHIRIFARMRPDDKVSVVQGYVNQGYITMMCGDGGNDCAALRTAHVGVALSDKDASVVSPFTGKSKSVMSCVEVLLEGRCGLASAFSSYKYMLMYGQVETINQIVNAWYGITFTEWCWVFMDGLWVVSMAFSLPFARASTTLADERPPSSLLGTHVFSSFLGVLIINFAFLCISLNELNKQDWYQCRKWEPGSIADANLIGDNYESSVIFLITGAQYFTSAMAYNFGFRFRQSWLTNWKFVLLLCAWIPIHWYITLVPSQLSCLFRINCEDPGPWNDNVDNRLRAATTDEVYDIVNGWHTTVMPYSFRWLIVGLIIANAAAIMLWEYAIVLGPVGRWFREMFRQTTPLKL